MMFTHFLLTQFNLRNFPKSSNKENEQWLIWTRERIRLFKIYCMPSVLNQTNKNFRWLIYFERQTPDEFLPFIEEIKRYDIIEVCYSDGTDDFFANYFQEIKKHIHADYPWVITTRLDNDDALHKMAIETIQQNFIEKHGFIVSLASGYVLDIERKVMAHYFYPMSPFISLIEMTSSNPTGIFSRPHTQWPSLKLFIFKELYFQFIKPKERPSRFILKQPMWIQIFHGKNVSNSFYRGFPVLKSIDLSDFAISFKSKKMLLTDIFKFWNYVNWKRYFKSYVVKLLLKK